MSGETSKLTGFPGEVLPTYLSGLDIPYYILEKDTYSIVKEVVPEGKTTCGLCSRLRRGSLYGFAREIGATRIAPIDGDSKKPSDTLRHELPKSVVFQT